MYQSKDSPKQIAGIDEHKFITMWALGMSDTELAIALDISTDQVAEIKTELQQKKH
ncbi:MAG: hypothetical protein ACQEQI_02100 [Bacillota bacterium]